MKSKLTAPTINDIAYVENGVHRLYVEVIQVIESRDRLWVRPLCLSDYDPEDLRQGHRRLVEVYDLRGGSDLVWPTTVFATALDLEWLEILAVLSPEAPTLGMLAKQEPDQAQRAKQKLRQFLATIEGQHQP